MPTYSLATLAEDDLKAIALYTLRLWGRSQAKRYVRDLRECFQLLAENPRLGRPCSDLHSGLRRFERGKHVVFYVVDAEGILVARVLHQKVVPEQGRLER